MASTSSATASTEQLITQFGQLTTLDDLIRLRAADPIQVPILAYPSSHTDAASYEYFTGKDLDGIIDQVAHTLIDCGFKPAKKDLSHGSRIVALFTPSDLAMVATLFALSRLGYTVMMLSPRLPATACVSLLDAVGCDTILYGRTANTRATMGEISQLKTNVICRLIPIHPRPVSSSLDTTTTFTHGHASPNPEEIALILHSSGSTGTPKPLFLTHKALMTHPLRGPELTSFNSLPWYHLHGLSTALQAMWMRKTAYMWNASLPVTGEGLIKALKEARPESVHAVPYVLQLLLDCEGGVEALKVSKLVTYGGAPCPDELGDRLVMEGVRFGGSFGLTEAGLVAESISRPPDDPFWNYMRFFENIRPYIWMKPVESDSSNCNSESGSTSLYECVYLKGHPALTTSNSDNPPGSFHSRDIFTPHPTLPERWKYATRLDDRITLVNGEKVLPLPIEGCIKQHQLIQDAVVVGKTGATHPGLLVFKSEKAMEMDIPDDKYLDTIWPVIEEANSRAEQFSRISRDTVAVLPYTSWSSCPRTDKGSLIRAQIYKHFSGVIDGIYTKFDIKKSLGNGILRLDIEETKTHLLNLCNGELGLSIPCTNTDFFSAGMDSLKAIHLRRLVLRDFDIVNSRKCLGQNVVFEAGNVDRLAERLVALQVGVDKEVINGEILTGEEVPADDGDDELALMSELIAKYSVFRRHAPVPVPRPGSRPRGGDGNMRSVILTGPTGSIGIHTLLELLNTKPTIKKIYCLTRHHENQEDPIFSILETITRKNLSSPPNWTERVIALNANLSLPDLGLDESTLKEMRKSVELIIHTAWSVNFRLPLKAFEESIRGLYHLIQFSLDVENEEMDGPAVVMFCSSISTAMRTMSSTKTMTETETENGIQIEIPETPLPITSALKMGYARSKLVGEKIISIARASVNARTYSLRIGQVSGHSQLGRWNDSEAIPLMIRSALTLKALPVLNEEVCSWVPVDKLARIIVEISSKKLKLRSPENGKDDDGVEEDGDDTVYNITNPQAFTWTELLSALQTRTQRGKSGFTFIPIPFKTWLQLLRESEEGGEENINPAVKLIDHYHAMYSGNNNTHTYKFRTDRAERDSETLRSGGELGIIRDGVLGRYVEDWLVRWQC